MPFRISHLCDVYVEGFNTFCNGVKLKGCWRSPPWLTSWGIAWKVERGEGARISLPLRYLDRNGVLVYGAATDVRSIQKINASEVVIAVAVGGREEELSGRVFGVIVASKYVSSALCSGEVLEAGFQFVGEALAVPDEIVENWALLLEAKQAACSEDTRGEPTPKKPRKAKQPSTNPAPRAKKVSSAGAAPRKASTSTAGEVAVARGEGGSLEGEDKNNETVEELIGTLGRAVRRGMLEEEIAAINRKLCDHLNVNFPYKRNTLGVKVHSSQLHVAPTHMKYRDIIPRRVDQLVVEYGSFSSIRLRPAIFAVPLKRKPSDDEEDSGNSGMSVVVESVPEFDFLLPGSSKRWFDTEEQHWYVIGGQHTVLACNRIAGTIAASDEERDYNLYHDVIVVHSVDASRFVALSSALNQTLKERDIMESYFNQLQRAREIWKNWEPPRPMPSILGRQHSEAHKVIL